MLNRIMELFGDATDMPEEACSSDRMSLATCVILLEIAGADNEFSPEECERIIEILRKRFDLVQEDAEELIRAAQDSRNQSFDLWKYTNQINSCCTPAEKCSIIEEVWRIIYSDGALDAHEDYLVHKLARLLNLDHSQLIEAKMKVRGEMIGG